MLISQHNGLGLGADAEVDVLQNLACSIGPRVDGIAAGVAVPQAMGAFSTFAAQAACAGRDQQQEQHQPTTTTTRGFGDTLTPIAPTSPSATTAMQRAVALRTATILRPVDATMVVPLQPTAPDATVAPLGPSVLTYPAGTITTFVAATNMWRVAVPVGSMGLGIFGSTAAFTEVAPTQAPPAGATQVSNTQFEKQTNTLPIYKKWQFWVAVAGGAVVIGGGALFLTRHKRAA